MEGITEISGSFNHTATANSILDIYTKKKCDKFNAHIELLLEKLKQKISLKDLCNVIKTDSGYQKNCTTIKRPLDPVDECKFNPYIIYAYIWEYQLSKIHYQLQLPQQQLLIQFIKQLQQIKCQLKQPQLHQLQYVEDKKSSSEYFTPEQSDQFHFTSTSADTPTSSKSKGSSSKSKKSNAPKKAHSKQTEDKAQTSSQPPVDNDSSSNDEGGEDEKDLEKLFSDNNIVENWCSIRYYEFNNQVGDTFHVKNNNLVVNINNFECQSTSDQFCLGSLNNVHRNQVIEQARKGIGSGILLYKTANGNVWLRQQCTEDERVFVESDFLVTENKTIPNRIAHQICTHAYNKVFSLKEYYKKIKLFAKDNPQSCDKLSNFKQFFTIRISFVEEWGPMCPAKTVEETACWIEVFIHSAVELARCQLSK